MLNLQYPPAHAVSFASRDQEQPSLSRMFDPHYARLIFVGQVTPEGIKWMVEQIDEAFNYYQYDVMKLEIESPGGNALALRYLMNRMKSWKARGKEIWTSSNMSAASAAALMLSMGELGRRRIDSFTALTYHLSRIAAHGIITAENAQQLQTRLDLENERMLDQLIEHVLDHNDWQAWRDRMLTRIAWSVAHIDTMDGSVKLRRARQGRLEKLAKTLSGCNNAAQLQGKYQKWLVTLFLEDRSIDNLEAWCLNLIDEIHEMTPHNRELANAPAAEPAPKRAGARVTRHAQ